MPVEDLPGRYSCIPHKALLLTFSEIRTLLVIGALTRGGLQTVPAVKVRNRLKEFFDIQDDAANKSMRKLYENGWIVVNDDKEIVLTEKYDVRQRRREPKKNSVNTEKNSVNDDQNNEPHAGVPYREKDQITNIKDGEVLNTNPQATKERRRAASQPNREQTSLLLDEYSEAEKTALPKDEAVDKIREMKSRLRRLPD